MESIVAKGVKKNLNFTKIHVYINMANFWQNIKRSILLFNICNYINDIGRTKYWIYPISKIHPISQVPGYPTSLD